MEEGDGLATPTATPRDDQWLAAVARWEAVVAENAIGSHARRLSSFVQEHDELYRNDGMRTMVKALLQKSRALDQLRAELAEVTRVRGPVAKSKGQGKGQDKARPSVTSTGDARQADGEPGSALSTCSGSDSASIATVATAIHTGDVARLSKRLNVEARRKQTARVVTGSWFNALQQRQEGRRQHWAAIRLQSAWRCLAAVRELAERREAAARAPPRVVTMDGPQAAAAKPYDALISDLAHGADVSTSSDFDAVELHQQAKAALARQVAEAGRAEAEKAMASYDPPARSGGADAPAAAVASDGSQSAEPDPEHEDSPEVPETAPAA